MPMNVLYAFLTAIAALMLPATWTTVAAELRADMWVELYSICNVRHSDIVKKMFDLLFLNLGKC